MTWARGDHILVISPSSSPAAQQQRWRPSASAAAAAAARWADAGSAAWSPSPYRDIATCPDAREPLLQLQDAPHSRSRLAPSTVEDDHAALLPPRPGWPTRQGVAAASAPGLQHQPWEPGAARAGPLARVQHLAAGADLHGTARHPHSVSSTPAAARFRHCRCTHEQMACVQAAPAPRLTATCAATPCLTPPPPTLRNHARDPPHPTRTLRTCTLGPILAS